MKIHENVIFNPHNVSIQDLCVHYTMMDTIYNQWWDAHAHLYVSLIPVVDINSSIDKQ